jgi:hypothetical protein
MSSENPLADQQPHNRGIQSRHFSHDSVAVSQLFPVRFVSSEMMLNHPAPLNMPFHFAFLMANSLFIFTIRVHSLGFASSFYYAQED